MSASRKTYVKTQWVNDETPLDEEHLNNLEEGVETNNALAKENANYIDEIYAAFIEQTTLAFNSETNELTLKFGSVNGSNPTTRFNASFTVGLPVNIDIVNFAREIYTERHIEDLDISCPPITYGIAGGEAEIATGIQQLTVLYGNGITGVKSAKVISRGKNQFAGFNEFIRVLSGEEYRIFTNLPSGLLLTEYIENKVFDGGYEDEPIGNDFILCGYEHTEAEYFFDEPTRFIKLTPANPTEVTDDTKVMVYLTFGESYSEEYEKPRIDEIVLPNITLRSVGEIRDEIYAEGGGIRRISDQGGILVAPIPISNVENPGWDPELFVDNYGTIQYLDENDEEIKTEQPYQIIYKISLAEFLDSAYVKAKGNASDIALVSEIENGDIVAGQAENIHTERTIDDLDISCPPITFGIAGGDAEIDTGVQEITKLFGNTVFDEGDQIYKSSKSAKLISRGKNQFIPLNSYESDYIDVIEGEEYRFFQENGNGIDITFFDKDKDDSFSSQLVQPDDVTFTIPEGCRYIKITGTHSNELGTNIMLYNTFGESYNEPHEEPSVSEIELPNIELHSIGNVRDEIYSAGGGLRKIGKFKVTNTGDLHPVTGYAYCYVEPQSVQLPQFNSINDIIILNADPEVIVEIYNGSIKITAHEIEDIIDFEFLYILEEPEEITTEENPGWDPKLFIDNYGTLMFQDEDGNEVEVEQPYEILYKVNLKEFLDSAFVKAAGDASDIALTSELENGDVVPAKSTESEFANALNVVSEDSGSRQTSPFKYQATATDNNTTETVTAPTIRFDELRGNSIDKHFETLLLQETTSCHSNLLNPKTGLYEISKKYGYESMSLGSFEIDYYSTYVFTMGYIPKNQNHSIIIQLIAKTDGGAARYYQTIQHVNSLYVEINPRISLSESDAQQFTKFIIQISINNLSNSSSLHWVFCYPKLINLSNLSFNRFSVSSDQIKELNNAFENCFSESNYPTSKTLKTTGFNLFSNKIGSNAVVNQNRLFTIKEWEEYDDNEFEEDGDFLYRAIKVLPATAYRLILKNTDIIDIESIDFFTVCKLLEEREIDCSWHYGNNNRNVIVDFTTTSETAYILLKLSIPDNRYSLTEYANNVCLNMVWDDSRKEFEEYEEHIYPLPNIELRKIGNVYDSIKYNGTYTKRIQNTTISGGDASTESYTYYDYDQEQEVTNTIFRFDDVIIKDGDTSNIVFENSEEIILPYGEFQEFSGWIDYFGIDSNVTGFFFLDENNTLCYIANDGVPAINEFEISYVLSEPEIVQNDIYKFERLVKVDDFGIMEFDSDVPQGNSIFYPADYMLLIDDMNKELENDGTIVASKTFVQKSINKNDRNKPNPDYLYLQKDEIRFKIRKKSEEEYVPTKPIQIFVQSYAITRKINNQRKIQKYNKQKVDWKDFRGTKHGYDYTDIVLYDDDFSEYFSKGSEHKLLEKRYSFSDILKDNILASSEGVEQVGGLLFIKGLYNEDRPQIVYDDSGTTTSPLAFTSDYCNHYSIDVHDGIYLEDLYEYDSDPASESTRSFTGFLPGADYFLSKQKPIERNVNKEYFKLAGKALFQFVIGQDTDTHKHNTTGVVQNAYFEVQALYVIHQNVTDDPGLIESIDLYIGITPKIYK